MIFAGSGVSHKAFTADAAEEAVNQALSSAHLSSAEVLFLFASPEYREDYSTLLTVAARAGGTSAVVGCSAIGVLTEEGEWERGPSVAVLALASEEIKGKPFLLSAGGEPEEIGTRLLEYLSPLEGVPSLVVLFPDPFNIPVDALVRELQEEGGLTVVGGAASGEVLAGCTYQWAGTRIAEDGVSGILFSGAFRPFIGVAQGCQPVGKPYVITRAEGNIIYQIGRRPALEVLMEAMETLPRNQVHRALGPIFAGIAIDETKYPLGRGDYLIRHVVGVDRASGAIGIADFVRPGQTIQFNLRDGQSAHEDLVETLQELKERVQGFTPRFGFYFNCQGRGMGLFGEPGHDIRYIREFFPEVPIVGFFGNAELAPIAGKNLVHGYTGVLVLFCQPE